MKTKEPKFSERIKKSRGLECKASWQVKNISGNLYHISCMHCGTVLQTGCTPKCLIFDTK